ncbi:MAG: phenylalanine--tRNA ligase subunit beta [Candidatus Algichlamydia australiensis]|nr:phenylalanine--tRNA ligase subunit beta [Chlamydiales bacterium]
MRVSLKWLNEWINLNHSPEEIADLLTLAGLEVEGIEKKKFPFTGVVFGKVLEAKQHPDADKLRIATVTDGKENFQVVCGAPNCREGLITAFAKVDAKLTDSKGKEFTIKKGKLRGAESFGMLCSNDELGFSLERESGIAEYENEGDLGKPLEEVFGDTFFEVSLTPNLGHCMSLFGIARELSALTQIPLTPPSFSIETSSSTRKISVDVKDQEACPRYVARLVENVQVCDSPEWLVEKLESVGVKPKNAIVDITNYIMFELGQPMHAFDADKIAENKIVVKRANKECQLKTLDDVERTIPEQTLLICDAQKPLAVAGVMGGADSAVTETTTNVLLEAAFFAPSTVRSGSKNLSLRTDSSARFEKGTDPEMTLTAIDRAAMLLKEICGGSIAEEKIDCKREEFSPRRLSVRLSRTNKLLGTKLSLNEAENLLSRLDLQVNSDGKEKIEVDVPAYRHDIKEEIDLIEEIARLYGYNTITPSKPLVTISTIPHSPLYLLEKKFRTRLINSGLQEFITCDLLSPKLSKLCLEDEMHEEKLISVLKPASVDQSILRTSLLPGHLQALKLNQNHKWSDIQAFEIGKIHFKEADQYLEKRVVGITLTGKERPYHYNPKPAATDFFTAKGILEELFASLNLKKISWEQSTLSSLHPHIQAAIMHGKAQIGSIGQVHPNIAAEMGLLAPIFFAEIDLEMILTLLGEDVKMEPLPLYPGVTRDLTLKVKKQVTLKEILSVVKSAAPPLLKNIELRDVYESEDLGEFKSITLRFTYRHEKKTLETSSVEKIHSKIVEKTALTFPS